MFSYPFLVWVGNVDGDTGFGQGKERQEDRDDQGDDTVWKKKTKELAHVIRMAMGIGKPKLD